MLSMTTTIPAHLNFASALQYVPASGEDVIGIIVQKHSEGFRVDIGSAQLAQLGQFAFEGASKKTKPRLDVRLVSLMVS
jgi:exosome complex component RRP40